MNCLLKLALVASLMVTLASCRGFPNPNPSPTPSGSQSVNARFWQVTAVTPDTAVSAGWTINGQGDYWFAGSQPPGCSPAPATPVSSEASIVAEPPMDAMALNVTFDPSIDSSDCVANAQEAETSGAHLLIEGTGTVTYPPAEPLPADCLGAGVICNTPASSDTPTINFTAITSCTLETGSGGSSSGGTSSSGSSSGGGTTASFSTHFSAVTSAGAGYCPDGGPCAMPMYCLAGAPDCGVYAGPSIVGPATTTYEPAGAGSSAGSGASNTVVSDPITIGPVTTTLTYPSSSDSTNDCLTIAEKAQSDGHGLTVTGVGTVTQSITTPCVIPPGSNIACPIASNAYIVATQILTCVED